MEATTKVETTRPEGVNALGALQAKRPAVARRCEESVGHAYAITYMLRALDGYQDRSGEPLEALAKHIRKGRVQVRCAGPYVTVVTP